MNMILVFENAEFCVYEDEAGTFELWIKKSKMQRNAPFN